MLKFGLRKVCDIFKSGNTCVTGLRGRGKDLLMSNVVARRKLPYISNIDYHCKSSQYIRLDFPSLDTKNEFQDFIDGTIKKYDYPYPDGADIYISDSGIYLPAQYYTKLDKLYGYLSTFMALSRHLGDCNVHINAQNLNRVWDKVREQSDMYILCRSCKVLFGKLVFMRILVYDKYQSCIDRVKPFKPQIYQAKAF